ncbi:MAG: MerR family transcriptional regulator [Elusimicrobia bacterium]|nr:MerR family transcriptional regulator [Elusimicrobiota bacterium]
MNAEAPLIPDQDFFTMGEACRIAQVAPYTLRYWEARVGFPRPARRSSGHRRYGRADLETIFEIKRLLVGRRLTAAGARKALLERRRAVRTGFRPDGADGTSDAVGAGGAAARLLHEVGKELKELASELAK